MKKQKIRGRFCLVLCVALLIFCIININQTGTYLQYTAQAPAPIANPNETETEQSQEYKPNQGILDIQKRFDEMAEINWPGVISAYSLSAIKQNADFQPSGYGHENKQGLLTALGENALSTNTLLPIFGRMFFYDELKNGDRVIILDEQLALEMFKIAQPLNQKVTINGQEYTVIGIVRHEKKVGDYHNYGAYIPLAAIAKDFYQMDALLVTAIPIDGTGAHTTFEKDMGTLGIGGAMIDLHKEGMGAMLPIRVLLFGLGMAILLMFLRFWNRQLFIFYDDYKLRLRNSYAIKLMPRLSLAAVIFALGYGVMALGFAQLVAFIIEPVYTFPEWIPQVLVEWDDIKTAFWNVWQGGATITVMQTPEFINIKFYGMIIGWASAGAAISVILCFFTYSKKLALQKENQ